MLTKDQMDTLIGRLKVYGSESGRGRDHPNAIACRTAASVIIEQQAEIERLREYVADFANTKFEQIDNRGRNWRGPEDDEDPVTDWMTVDAWQEDARTALGATQ